MEHLWNSAIMLCKAQATCIGHMLMFQLTVSDKLKPLTSIKCQPCEQAALTAQPSEPTDDATKAGIV